nr:hypothetical protein [uncultured Anaerostipes sp.]
MDKTRQERYNLIYGNTARKMEAEPARRIPDERRRKVRHKPRPKTTPKTKQNQQKAMAIDFAFVRVLILAVIIVSAVSFFYLSEHMKVMDQKTALTKKKTELNTIQVENEDLALEIEQSINLEKIKGQAEKYGMKKPESEQVIHYDSTDVEYVRQYGDIPEAD